MNKKIDALRKTRATLLKLIDDLTIEELNDIPDGFNNNIAWNLGHLLATQQGICYTRAGLTRKIADSYFDQYKPDTKPEQFINSAEIEEIKKLFLSVVDQFEVDHTENLFSNYTPWKNRLEMELTDIDTAMDFVLFHEGLHRGYIMALKRLVKK